MEQNMEQPGPPPQVAESLRIIRDAIGFPGKFLMNRHQCESLTHRLYSIDEVLDELAKECNYVGHTSDAAVKLNYPAFDVLLTVLRKAEALLLKYRESKTSNVIPSVLTRGEDRQAFEEVHAELDMLNSSFHFDNFEYVVSETMLTANADEDLMELSTSLDGLAESSHVLELASNLEQVKLVVTEKSEGTSDGELPSYLNIDPASVEIKDPVRIPERLSKNPEDEKTDGWALVRFGTYLGCEFALKVFRSGNPTWNRGELLKEVHSLMELHHPHVVQLMGFAQDEEKCIILMELMDTDLRHFMKPRSRDGKRPFARSVEMDIITQIARALFYLHEQGYVHGELKCSNILVKQIGDAIDVKISDLRSSQRLGVWDPALFKERSSRVRSRWTAPEVRSYGASLEPTHELMKKADVYSFGMVCFEVVTGKLPFQDIRGEALERRITSGELKQDLPGELDEKLRALIESCWDSDPNARPTAENICHLLDFIRSSQPAEASISSGKATVMRLFQLIPPIMRLRGRRESPPAATWGHTESGEGIHDEARTVTLPEFVRIDPKKLKKGKFLGQGASADVHEVTWLGCQFAMKTFKGRGTSIAKEVKFLVELRHPCIVRLMGLAIHSERRCSIVMEFMGCSLRNLIDSRKRKRKIAQTAPFDLRETLHIVKRVAVGMAFLHCRGVMHRDLKADNILVPNHPGSIDVKITDFGVSELIDPSEQSLRPEGTSFWRAPEMFHQTQGYDLKAADVYSFAMTCYEVVSGRTPFEDKEVGTHAQVRSDVNRGLRPTLPCDLHPELKLLIEECWHAIPEKRPTFSNICQTLQKIQHGLQNS